MRAMMIAVLMLAVSSCTEQDASAPDVLVHIDGKPYPATLLPETRGPETNMDAFAKHVAPQFREFSAKSDTEACAMICKAPNGVLGIAPLSIGAHVTCPITTNCPEGMTSVGQTIHSHPSGAPYRVNRADMVVLGTDTPKPALGDLMPRREPGFSDEDFGMPGYLVQGTQVYHQAGRISVRILSP